MNFITKRCLLCLEREDPVELYPRTFKGEDLTPDVFSARRPVDRVHYRIVRCRNCGLVFSREMLPDDVLSRLYAQSSVTYGQYTGVLRRDYWRPLKPFAASFRQGCALEIGCGSGFFLEELLARGCRKVRGCEPSITARQMAAPHMKERITAGMFREGMFPEADFDLVCSFHTLDHLSEPGDALHVVHGLLRPGGIAYFVTHDVDSLQARLLGERSPIIDVEHVYLFNTTTLRKLFEHAGFRVNTVHNLWNSYPLEYWMHMIPVGQRFIEPVRTALRGLGLGSIPIPLRAGNIFLIAQRTL